MSPGGTRPPRSSKHGSLPVVATKWTQVRYWFSGRAALISRISCSRWLTVAVPLIGGSKVDMGAVYVTRLPCQRVYIVEKLGINLHNNRLVCREYIIIRDLLYAGYLGYKLYRVRGRITSPPLLSRVVRQAAQVMYDTHRYSKNVFRRNPNRK